MASVQSEILEAFCAKLAKTHSLDERVIEALRKALATDKKLKADDFVSILAMNRESGKP